MRVMGEQSGVVGNAERVGTSAGTFGAKQFNPTVASPVQDPPYE
jgi:hypothetical protein